MVGTEDRFDAVVDATAYLARSGNRIELLQVLAAGNSRPGDPPEAFSSRTLRDRLSISRSTCARILDEFIQRDWVQRTPDGNYTITPRGSHVEASFSNHLESLTAIEHLGDAVAILPHEELQIGLEHFADATVRRPMSGDPTELSRRLARSVEEASQFTWLSYIGPPRSLDVAVQEGILSGRLSARGVITDTLAEYYRENLPSDRLETWQQDDRLRPHTDGGLQLYRHDEHIPCNLFVVDDTTIIENSQVRDLQPGTIIETDNDTVRMWAERTIQRYVEASERVEPLPQE